MTHHDGIAPEADTHVELADDTAADGAVQPLRTTAAGFALGVLRRLGPVPVIAIAAYLLLTLTGATTSSMGIQSFRVDPAHPVGLQIGTSRAVRSDEWLTITPIELGRLASGSTRADTPLATSPDLIYQVPNGSVGESIVFFDGDLFKLGGVFPQSMLFAAWWWLPSLLLVLSLPAWLMRLGSTRNLAWFATGLTVFAPSAAWWSMFPIRILGFVVAGSYLLIRAVDHWIAGRRGRAVPLALVAAVFFVRLPTFYIPWSITIGLPVLLATLVWLLWPPATRRHAAVVIAGAGVVAIGLLGLLLLENRAAISAAAGTVYPGQRRSNGLKIPASQRFGAPMFSLFYRGQPGPKGTNLSELSSAFTFTAGWALVVWIGTKRRGWDRNRAATAVLAIFTAFWLAWCSFHFGAFGKHLPIANRVPPVRAAQTLGFLAVFVLALVLSRTVGKIHTLVAVAAAAASGLITLWGAHSMRIHMPRLGWTYIVVTVLIVAALVFLVTSYRDRVLPVIACLVLAGAQVITVNPLIFGFGDLRSSTTARFIRSAYAAHPHGYWATDSLTTDGLLIANGLPMLSGHQVTGPVRSEWRKLDPTGRYEKIWNRGTSYLEFRWTTNAVPVISSPGRDQVVVLVDPCALAGLGFPMAGIVSIRPVPDTTCLLPEGRFVWFRRSVNVYSLAPG